MIAARITADVAAASLDASHPLRALASAPEALRSVQTPGLWLWLVRLGAAEAVGTLTLVLLDRLPGLLVAAAQGLGRHV
jgi:hypothetical protein